MGSPLRWQSPLSSVETHESIQEAVVTSGYVSASMFAFGITSSDALEQLIQDILLNTEAFESTLGVTAANVLPQDELVSSDAFKLASVRCSPAEVSGVLSANSEKRDANAFAPCGVRRT